MGSPAAPRLAVDLLDHDLFADHEPWEVFEALQRRRRCTSTPRPTAVAASG